MIPYGSLTPVPLWGALHIPMCRFIPLFQSPLWGALWFGNAWAAADSSQYARPTSPDFVDPSSILGGQPQRQPTYIYIYIYVWVGYLPGLSVKNAIGPHFSLLILFIFGLPQLSTTVILI